MNKQGLIAQKDFRETLSGIEEDMLKRGDVLGSMAGTIAGVITLLDESPTIDPESLPIVQELRAENVKLNTEIVNRERASILQDDIICYWRDKANAAEAKLVQYEKAGQSGQPLASVHAYWEYVKMYDDCCNVYKCSHCGYVDEHNPRVDVPYCWHCGAIMNEGK